MNFRSVILGLLFVLCSTATAREAAAQTVMQACYVDKTGVVYRIDPSGTLPGNLPTECTKPDKHVAFSLPSPAGQTCPAGQVVVGFNASSQLICEDRPLPCTGTEAVPHLMTVAFTEGAAFGMTAPAVAHATFDVPCSALQANDPFLSGTLVSNFSMQIGSQAFHAGSATAPTIQTIHVINGRVVGMASNFTQNGVVYLQMAIDGTSIALESLTGGPFLRALAGGQKFGRFYR
jgi:hypothetical protein